MGSHNRNPLVFDNGSDMFRAGFAGEYLPSIEFHNMIGRPRAFKGSYVGSGQKEMYVGEDCYNKRGLISVVKPVEAGIIKDWDEMLNIWHHVFDFILMTDSKDYPIVTSESPLNPRSNRERMVEVVFEGLNSPCFYVGMQPVMSLLSRARHTALVFESGDAVSYCIPVYKCYTMPHNMIVLNYAGEALNDYMCQIFGERGYPLKNTAQRDAAKDMKEKFGYIAMDYLQEKANSDEFPSKYRRSYELPDGRPVRLKYEHFRCPDALFHPQRMGIKEPSMAKAIYDCIQTLDPTLHNMYYNRITLTGSTTTFVGISGRLYKELKLYTPQFQKIKITAIGCRKYANWIGCSVLACSSQIKKMWITKQEYEDHGPGIVSRKCF